MWLNGRAEMGGDVFLVVEELPVPRYVVVGVVHFAAGWKGVDGLRLAASDAADDRLLVLKGVVVALDL